MFRETQARSKEGGELGAALIRSGCREGTTDNKYRMVRSTLYLGGYTDSQISGLLPAPGKCVDFRDTAIAIEWCRKILQIIRVSTKECPRRMESRESTVCRAGLGLLDQGGRPIAGQPWNGYPFPTCTYSECRGRRARGSRSTFWKDGAWQGNKYKKCRSQLPGHKDTICSLFQAPE